MGWTSHFNYGSAHTYTAQNTFEYIGQRLGDYVPGAFLVPPNQDAVLNVLFEPWYSNNLTLTSPPEAFRVTWHSNPLSLDPNFQAPVFASSIYATWDGKPGFMTGVSFWGQFIDMKQIIGQLGDMVGLRIMSTAPSAGAGTLSRNIGIHIAVPNDGDAVALDTIGILIENQNANGPGEAIKILGGSIVSADASPCTGPGTGALQIGGGAYVNDDLFVGGDVKGSQLVQASQALATLGAFTRQHVLFLNADILVTADESIVEQQDIMTAGHTVTLPAVPRPNQILTVMDSSGTVNAGHALTIQGNGNLINNAATLILNSPHAYATLTFNGGRWTIIGKG